MSYSIILLMNQWLGCIPWTSWNVVFVLNVVISYIPPGHLFISQVGSMLCLWHSLELGWGPIVPTHRVMARLSWPGWLVTYWNVLPVCHRSPIQVLTSTTTSHTPTPSHFSSIAAMLINVICKLFSLSAELAETI